MVGTAGGVREDDVAPDLDDFELPVLDDLLPLEPPDFPDLLPDGEFSEFAKAVAGHPHLEAKAIDEAENALGAVDDLADALFWFWVRPAERPIARATAASTATPTLRYFLLTSGLMIRWLEIWC